MNEALFSLIAFIVAISVLITVHEFGHFWVARRLGVKVLRFSVGFGHALWKRRFGADRTELVVAALPLGGYVKMLDEREGEVPPEEAHRAFNRQSLGVRTAIVAAGPIFNLLFAVIAYWVMYTVGISGVRPVIGAVAPDSPAAVAGLRDGDEVIRVGDNEVQTLDALVLELLEAALDDDTIEVEVRRTDGTEVGVTIAVPEGELLDDDGSLLDALGITPWRPRIEAVIGGFEAGSPAEQAGLQPGDRVLEADGQPMDDWQAWADYVRARPEVPIEIRVARGDEVLDLTITPARVENGDQVIGRIGAYAEIDEDQFAAMRVQVRYGPLEAFAKGWVKTGEMIGLTLRLLWSMVTGQASAGNLSGPISIAQYAGHSASVGLAPFLAFLGLVSISLGILNLLPIPVLDGGHLMWFALEWIQGKPVSEQAQLMGQRIGIAVLLALMTLAFYNDLLRLFG